MNNIDEYTVKRMLPDDIMLLTQLFDYHDIDEMVAENTRNLEQRIIDIFVLYCGERLVGELHVKYESSDAREAVRGRRAYLFAFRVHKDFQGAGLGTFLLEQVLNILAVDGYSEFTVGVEDDNERAKHIYDCFGFCELVARKQEEYQGDCYEYNLYIRRAAS